MRRVLVVLLAVGMAVLSFDALRAYALTGHPLTDGVIPQQTILPRSWLAMLWAVVVDLAVAAGILGVKDDRGDWRAWLMLLLALGATLGFQVFALSPFLARAVPPVGLALAILVLDLGPARPKPATEARPPWPARARAWFESGLAVPTPTQPEPALVVSGPRSRRQQAATPAPSRPSGLTADQQARVKAMIDEGGWSDRAIQRELGLTNYARTNHLAPLAKELRANNGAGP